MRLLRRIALFKHHRRDRSFCYHVCSRGGASKRALARRRPAPALGSSYDNNIRQYGMIMGILSFLLGIFGCNKQTANEVKHDANSDAPPVLTAPVEITSELEEDAFVDLVLYIEKHERLADGSQLIRGSGTHKGVPVGLDVILGNGWRKGSLGKDIPIITYSGSVTYHSVGAGSDSFVQAVDELYGTKLKPVHMAPDTRFDGISLEGTPADLQAGPVKIKLFYEPDSEDRYAELYTNIDLTAHRLEVFEKDEEYRTPLVKALSNQ